MGKEIDSELVRQLAELLEETGLSEIEYGKDGWHVRVARHAGGTVSVTAPATPSAAPEPSGAAEPPATPEAMAEHPGAVTSPMVGVAYLAPEPNAPDFVSVGDTVTEGQTLLLIEAMKVFNPIHASHGGTVKAILVENGAPVEFGEALVIIE
jgi:acetyl-CoA carboxylase biotin carboxyl carrier protein